MVRAYVTNVTRSSKVSLESRVFSVRRRRKVTEKFHSSFPSPEGGPKPDSGLARAGSFSGAFARKTRPAVSAACVRPFTSEGGSCCLVLISLLKVVLAVLS